VAALALPFAADTPLALLASAVVGLLIGPVLVAGYALVESRADRERVTELLAYPSLGLGAGIPLGSTFAGVGLDAAGPVLGFTVMAASCVATLVLGATGELLLSARPAKVPVRVP
jgi:predicted MFS family arabinose efflux permease